MEKKKNLRELRKHFRLMTELERISLMKRRDKLAKTHIEFNKHSKKRMINRKISKNQIFYVIKHGAIMEYCVILDDEDNIVDERLHLRSLKPRKYQTTIVVSLKNNTLITCYSKHIASIKYKKNFSMYDEKLKILIK